MKSHNSKCCKGLAKKPRFAERFLGLLGPLSAPKLGMIAVLLLWGLSGACTSYASDVPPGFNLTSPKETKRYMQWAVEKKSAHHLYNCLSQAMINRHDITLVALETHFDEVMRRLDAEIGNPLEIEIIEVHDTADPRRKLVDLRTPTKRAQVAFVLETSYSAESMKRTRAGFDGQAESMSSIMTWEGNTAVLRLPAEYDDDPESFHRIIIRNAWKLDGLPEGPSRTRMDKILKEEAKPQP